MLKRFLLTTLFVVFFPFQTKPVAGTELIAGAIVYKILSTQAVRTMGAVMAGYFLNSSAGKQFSGKMKDFAIKKIFSNHQTNHFRLTSDSDVSSYFYSSSNAENKSNSIDKFSQTTNIQELRKKLRSMASFSQPNTRLSSLYVKAQDLGSRFVNSEKVQMLKNEKITNPYQKESKPAGQFMYQQVKGFCPKIENNFYSDGYWKGFAQGSFVSWLSAWYLSDNKKEKKEQGLQNQKPLVVSLSSADLVRNELFKQGEVSLTGSDIKMS